MRFAVVHAPSLDTHGPRRIGRFPESVPDFRNSSAISPMPVSRFEQESV